MQTSDTTCYLEELLNESVCFYIELLKHLNFDGKYDGYLAIVVLISSFVLGQTGFV